MATDDSGKGKKSKGGKGNRAVPVSVLVMAILGNNAPAVASLLTDATIAAGLHTPNGFIAHRG